MNYSKIIKLATKAKTLGDTITNLYQVAGGSAMDDKTKTFIHDQIDSLEKQKAHTDKLIKDEV